MIRPLSLAAALLLTSVAQANDTLPVSFGRVSEGGWSLKRVADL